MSELDLSERILHALIQNPWASTSDLTQVLSALRLDVLSTCQALAAAGLIQIARHSRAIYSRRLYAPTHAGIQRSAGQLGVSCQALLRAYAWSEERFWIRRVCFQTVREVSELCARIRQRCRTQGGDAFWETFLQRQQTGKAIFLHARLNLIRATDSGSQCHALYVLIDRGEDSVWMWWRHLHYFETWAQRVHESFPPLLILTTRPFRCTALLALAHSLCPHVPVIATADREIALTGDLTQAAWWMPTDRQRAQRVQPFGGAALSLSRASPRHLIREIKIQKHRDVEPDDAVIDAAHPVELAHLPESLSALPAIESLSDHEYDLLVFLSQHPLCTRDLLTVFLSLEAQALDAMSARLCQCGLAEWHELREGETIVQVLTATSPACRLLAIRTGSAAGERMMWRFAQAQAEHARRLQHTLDLQAVFIHLHQHAAKWSQVLRKIDAPVRAPNAGDIPHYELEVFEEDMTATAHFSVAGNRRKWLPDGYGVLRAGEVWLPFWVEMDGTRRTRSRYDAGVWTRKFDNLCAYMTTGKWRLRHPAFPMTLIVTNDLRNYELICDTLHTIAHGQDCETPHVFVASWAALEQRGPLAPIWRAAHDLALPGFQPAFPPLPRLADSPEADI